MCDIKTMNLNKIMADRISANLEIDLSCKKVKENSKISYPTQQAAGYFDNFDKKGLS
jgi:hypothetical protein